VFRSYVEDPPPLQQSGEDKSEDEGAGSIVKTEPNATDDANVDVLSPVQQFHLHNVDVLVCWL
jgi:hypothetical protein